MTDDPLKSLSNYSDFIAKQLDRPSIEHSTLAVWSDSPFTGIAEGDIFFKDDYRLHIREELDFDEGIIAAYGYETYQGSERLYWYDDFPHPKDPKLASTHPHHKHVPPDIKRNRIPAPGISFNRGNLLTLIQEVESLIKE
jgi:hypothetical protein